MVCLMIAFKAIAAICRSADDSSPVLTCMVIDQHPPKKYHLLASIVVPSQTSWFGMGLRRISFSNYFVIAMPSMQLPLPPNTHPSHSHYWRYRRHDRSAHHTGTRPPGSTGGGQQKGGGGESSLREPRGDGESNNESECKCSASGSCDSEENDRADYVNQNVFNPTGKTSSSTRDGSTAKYGVVPSADSSPFFAPSEREETECDHLFVEAKAEDGGSSQSSYSWASAHASRLQIKSNMTKESVASHGTQLRQEQASLHATARNLRVCLVNQRW